MAQGTVCWSRVMCTPTDPTVLCQHVCWQWPTVASSALICFDWKFVGRYNSWWRMVCILDQVHSTIELLKSTIYKSVNLDIYLWNILQRLSQRPHLCTNSTVSYSWNPSQMGTFREHRYNYVLHALAQPDRTNSTMAGPCNPNQIVNLSWTETTDCVPCVYTLPYILIP